MNAHDPRTLEERLEWIANWSEPDIDLADAGTAREALDRIRAQKARIQSLETMLVKAGLLAPTTPTCRICGHTTDSKIHEWCERKDDAVS